MSGELLATGNHEGLRPNRSSAHRTPAIRERSSRRRGELIGAGVVHPGGHLDGEGGAALRRWAGLGLHGAGKQGEKQQGTPPRTPYHGGSHGVERR